MVLYLRLVCSLNRPDSKRGIQRGRGKEKGGKGGNIRNAQFKPLVTDFSGFFKIFEDF